MPLDNIRGTMQSRQPYMPRVQAARPSLPSALMQKEGVFSSRPQVASTQKPPRFNSRAGMDVMTDYNTPRMSPLERALRGR